MRKSLSEREQNAIRKKLIDSCRICWTRYGYKKTGVAELASRSGIATGTFYAFFPSKEMLFMETADTFVKELYALMATCKPEAPTKYNFADGLKKCVDAMFKNPWIFSLRADLETFLRKLPEDYLEKDFQKDVLDIATVVDLYGLIPKVPMEEITAVFHTLLMSIYLTDIIGQPHKQALTLLIDSVIPNLFI